MVCGVVCDNSQNHSNILESLYLMLEEYYQVMRSSISIEANMR